MAGAPHDSSPAALIFGCGYVGLELARILTAAGWQVAGTARSAASLAQVAGAGAQPLGLDDAAVAPWLACSDLVVGSIPPDGDGDPAVRLWHAALVARPAGSHAVYLSTTGVYGDRGGRWAFEQEAPTPASPEATRRVVAENQWLALPGPVSVLRLPGIYGPGRSALDQLRVGTARAVVKPGQVFSRIHRDDIAAAIQALAGRPGAAGIYNLADDEPAPSHLVTLEAARLLGVPPPPLQAHDPAALSPMAQRFWSECKRIPNARAKASLGWRPRFATYREGLAACLAAGRT